MAVYFLDENDDWFPAAEYAEEDGLLAAGGDLTPKRLLAAYRLGIFPWYQEGGPILWWCPHSRYVIIPSEIHVSASMAKFMRKTALRVSFDEDFAAVIHHCRILREDKEGTWITDAMEASHLQPGNYQIGGLDVIVKDGAARLASNGALAGSILRMNHALRNVHEVTGLPLSDIIRCTSLNQAEELGITDLGRIEAGYRANLTVLDDAFEVAQVFLDGKARL